MVLLTVLLAKGVPECTTARVLVSGEKFVTKTLSASRNPVWGDDFTVQDMGPGEKTVLVCELMNGESKVGQAKLELDPQHMFGHKPLPVEPSGSLMVSWSSAPVSLEAAPQAALYSSSAIMPSPLRFAPGEVPTLPQQAHHTARHLQAGQAQAAAGAPAAEAGPATAVLLHQILEEMRTMQQKMKVLTEQQARLEDAVATLQPGKA